MRKTTTSFEMARRFEGDARAVTALADEIGGTVVYLNGQVAYYGLDGEWFQAATFNPSSGSRTEPTDPAEPESGARSVAAAGPVSTS